MKATVISGGTIRKLGNSLRLSLGNIGCCVLGKDLLNCFSLTWNTGNFKVEPGLIDGLLQVKLPFLEKLVKLLDLLTGQQQDFKLVKHDEPLRQAELGNSGKGVVRADFILASSGCFLVIHLNRFSNSIERSNNFI